MYGWEQCRQQRYELVMGEMSVQIILMAILPIVALISSTIRHVLLVYRVCTYYETRYTLTQILDIQMRLLLSRRLDYYF